VASRFADNNAILQEPVEVPLSTTPQERLELLEAIARRGTIRPTTRNFHRWALADCPRAAPCLLAAVQRLPFRPTPSDRQRFNSVPWTLHYGGACGDLAAALRSVYLLADVPSRLVWLPLTRDGYAFNHVSVQIAVGPQWAWAEPCVLGARIGDHPLAAAARARDWRPFA
jgi:hypothetical protein